MPIDDDLSKRITEIQGLANTVLTFPLANDSQGPLLFKDLLENYIDLKDAERAIDPAGKMDASQKTTMAQGIRDALEELHESPAPLVEGLLHNKPDLSHFRIAFKNALLLVEDMAKYQDDAATDNAHVFRKSSLNRNVTFQGLMKGKNSPYVEDKQTAEKLRGKIMPRMEGICRGLGISPTEPDLGGGWIRRRN